MTAGKLSFLDFALAKTTAFACLFRHATSFFLSSLFAAEFWSRFSADAKAGITVALAYAESARG
jgi:hypothetical protein